MGHTDFTLYYVILMETIYLKLKRYESIITLLYTQKEEERNNDKTLKVLFHSP